MKIVYENVNIPKVISFLTTASTERSPIELSPFLGIFAFSFLQSSWAYISSLSKHVKSPQYTDFLIL